MPGRVRILLQLSLAALVPACGGGSRPWGAAVEAPAGVASRAVSIDVTERGFEPDHLTVAVGETVRLVFTRRVERTCVTRVILWLAKDHRIERALPVGVRVPVVLRFERPGELGLNCPMQMYGATITIR